MVVMLVVETAEVLLGQAGASSIQEQAVEMIDSALESNAENRTARGSDSAAEVVLLDETAV